VVYAKEVFRIISENPGINGGEIVRKLQDEFDSDITIQHLNSVLGGLKRRSFDSIENRGSTGLSARWYVCEPEPHPEPHPYLDEAQRILRELKRIIPNQRAEWLAEQIQALVDPE
jgi:hypothetical protein